MGWRCGRRRARRQLGEQPLCAFCLQNGRVVPATIADHVVSHRGDGRAFRLDALQSLCKDCHDRKEGLGQRGYLDDIGLDGYPVDPRRPFNQPRTR